eukprot:6490358-Amphidinium_carterae.2
MSSSSAARNLLSVSHDEACDVDTTQDESCMLAWASVAAGSSVSSCGSASAQGGQSLLHVASDRPGKKKRGRPPTKLRALLADFQSAPCVVHVSGGRGSCSSERAVVPKVAPTNSMRSTSLRVEPAETELCSPKHGRMVPVGFLPKLLAVLQNNDLLDAECFDAVVLDIARFYFTHGSYHIVSGQVMEKLFACDPQGIQRRMNRLCCCLLFHQYHIREFLERQVTEQLPRQSLLFYLDFSCYNETPMKITLKDQTLQRAIGTLDPAFVGIGVPHPYPIETERGQSVIAKVLQTNSSWGFLVRYVDGLLAVKGQFFSPLQSMDRASGKNLAACLSQMSGVSFAADNFSLKVRSTCSDQAAYNILGESLMAQSRRGWCSAQWPCDVHAVAAIHKKCFEDLFSPHVCGLLHAALGLRVAHSWATFKEALTLEVYARDIEVTNASSCQRDALEHKFHLLTLAFHGAASGLAHAVQLLLSFPGDWRSNSLQYVWNDQDGEMPTLKHIKQGMAQALLATLCNGKPTLWPRHRWTGFRAAIRPFLMLSSIHNLLEGTFKRFLSMLGSKKSPNPGIGHPISQGSLQSASEHHPIALNIDSDGLAAATTHTTSEVEHFDTQDGHESTNYSAINAKDRALALKWLTFRCPSHVEVLKLFAIVLAPLDHLLQQHLLLASKQWEHEQCIHAMHCVISSLPIERTYRLQIAADMTLETKFLEEVANIYANSALWFLLPSSASTFAFRFKAFLMLSRMGCCVEATLCTNHRKYPTRLFTLLSDPSSAASLASDARCLMDRYTLEVLQTFPDFAGAECLAALRLQASEQKVDISMVEALHGSIRRQVCIRSCQTWTATLTQVSAEWLMQSWRRARKTVEKGHTKPTRNKVFGLLKKS